MAVVSDLEYERNRYCNLRDNIKQICTKLNNNINSLQSVEQSIEKNFKVDDEKFIYEDLTKEIDNLKTMHDNLINKIMPAINSKIAAINISIKEIQAIGNI